MDRILIIEDDAEIRERTAELLKLSGYEIHIAANGIEGLMLLRKRQVDLILCDVMMPELDGYGVLRAIRNIPGLAGIPLIFMTSKAEEVDFRKVMDLGADDCLVKPFPGEVLLRVVNARLERSKLFRQENELWSEDLSELMNNSRELLNTLMFHERGEAKKIRKKEAIFMEGDAGSQLYLVLSGKIKTYRSNAEGKEYITGLYLPGDFFGYNVVISESNRKESAIALEDSEIAMLSKREFQRLLISDKTFSLQVIMYMMRSIDEAEQRMLRLAYDSARSRVAQALLFLFQKYNAAEGDTIPVSRENLSTLAGISPESASRHLSDLRDEGLIETFHGAVKICSVYKLEHQRF